MASSVAAHNDLAENVISWATGFTWWPSRWSTRLIVVFVVVTPLITKLVSTGRFYHALWTKSKDGRGTIPVVPYWIPGLYHLIPFVSNTAEFPLSITKRYGSDRPIRFKAGGSNFTVVANPNHILTIYKNSRFLSAKSITERSARYLLDIPDDVMPFYQADDSGMAAEVRRGSKVTQENRILYQQTHTAQKYLASPYLEPMTQRYLDFFEAGVEALGIGEDWVEYPDLYSFCKTTVSGANIQAMMGSKIMELNPTLVEDFWTAKAFAPEYFRGLPRWLASTAFSARDRIIGSVRAWHDYSFANGDHTNTGPQDPDWDPIWGSKYSKIRQQFMLKMKPLTAHVRAAEDWGLMFGANGNTAPVVFWYLLEALKNPTLCAQMMAEVSNSSSKLGAINVKDLATQPLLQSAYAEVLRLRVSILISRIVEYQDITFEGYTLPRGEYILMPTDAMHFNDDAWNQTGRASKVPLSQFDATRFLVPSKDGSEFDQEGLAGLWIPFGGGDRMCPGRHLAKQEMLISFAYLFSKYDIELGSIDADQVSCDRRYAAFGALPPNRKVPFRIRKKGRKQ